MERAPENLDNQIQGNVITITGTPQIKLLEHKPRTESHNREKKSQTQDGSTTNKHIVQPQKQTKLDSNETGKGPPKPPEKTHQNSADADQESAPPA